MVKLAMLASRVRLDEKMLLDAATARGVDITVIDDRRLTMPVHGDIAWTDENATASRRLARGDFDAVIERGISYWHSYYATLFLHGAGIPCVNEHEVLRRCGDKAETSLLLARAGVETPRTIVAVDEESALAACESLGYPVVLKPVVGSWGRLIAKADNREQAGSILEHKSTLGGPLHSVFYVQEYVKKPGRDIRAFMVGGDVIAAIYRTNDKHFITNTAQGGRASKCPVTPALQDICAKASRAVGGGVLAMDVMETPDGGLTCHEVNHTMEFKNSVAPTGVDIPGRIIEYAVEVAKGRRDP
ncbi:MAG: lysine biosynthesis protein LysX [Thermoplasmatota archaeon]